MMLRQVQATLAAANLLELRLPAASLRLPSRRCPTSRSLDGHLDFLLRVQDDEIRLSGQIGQHQVLHGCLGDDEIRRHWRADHRRHEYIPNLDHNMFYRIARLVETLVGHLDFSRRWRRRRGRDYRHEMSGKKRVRSIRERFRVGPLGGRKKRVQTGGWHWTWGRRRRGICHTEFRCLPAKVGYGQVEYTPQAEMHADGKPPTPDCLQQRRSHVTHGKQNPLPATKPGLHPACWEIVS
jgi:hypothetical protein